MYKQIIIAKKDLDLSNCLQMINLHKEDENE